MDNLQLLIASLTEIEKKKFAKEIKKFEGEKFTDKQAEALRRHFFQEHIVESLTSTYLIEEKVHIQWYYEAVVLFSKGLEVMANKRLRKAIDNAIVLEDFQMLYLMYQLEMNIALQFKDKVVIGIIESCASNKQKCIENIVLLAKYLQINLTLREYYNRNGIILNQEIELYLEKEVREHVEMDIPEQYPVTVKHLIYKIRYLYLLFKNDPIHALASNEKMVAFTKQHMNIFSMDDFYIELFNLCYMILSLNQEEKFLFYFDQIDVNLIKNSTIRMKHLLNKIKLKSSYYLTMHKYQEGLFYFETAVNFVLKKFNDKIDVATRFAIYAEYAFVCFHNQKYDRTMDMINDSLKLSKAGFRDDVINTLKIMEIVCCYHLGLSTLLLSKCKSYIKYHPEYCDPKFNEYVLVQFFMKTHKEIVDDEKMKDYFVELKASLTQNEELINYTKIQHKFSISSWIDDCILSLQGQTT